ncbi:HAMP domain-containing sensor histidine kinase [Viridibacterium curvum]|uniref:histidine kinase n=1 Tax=Viridibacterium curvum TaxID=1101404 RepID=A0ABP9QH84_9RHOO
MQLRYPGSFLKLLLIGFGLVALPLVLALGDAYVALEKLTDRSEKAIAQAVRITRLSRELDEQITGLDRIARQQLVLGERGLIDAYTTRRAQFIDTVEQLQQNARASNTTQELNALADSEATAWEGLQRDKLTPAETRKVIEEFGHMHSIAAEVLSRADIHIERDIRALRAQADLARTQLLWRLLILIPVGLILVGGVIVLIRRPIRQLGRGIRDLGDGLLQQRIIVSGPRDLEALGHQLDWLRLRLTEVDDQKMRFLRHVSHELKTPLTAIYEGTHLLSDEVTGKLTEDQQEVVAILRSNAGRLRQLIENLLDYSGIRFKPMLLKREPVLLASLFAELAADQKLALTARKLSLLPDDGGLTVEADREKLRVVLDNLLSNAAKYAPEESIIDMIARQVDDDVHIEIADLGPGIPPDQRERVFEPFVQGAPPPDDVSIKGTGLGLSIVQELVTAHGGSVTIRDNKPCGTRITVRLPLQPDSQSQ